MITRRFLFPLRSGQVAETVRTLDALKTQALAALEQKTDLNQLDPAVDALPAPLRPVLAPVFAPVLTQSLQPLPAGRPARERRGRRRAPGRRGPRQAVQPSPPECLVMSNTANGAQWGGGWGGGYVTDVAYTAGHYPFQSPWHLEAACLLHSVQPPAIGPSLSYIELGCGRGYGALILAASNPGWTVTALDFHPAHIAEARHLAQQASVHNAVFIKADLADPATIALLPEADIVSLHGVWSWVPPQVRAGIAAVLKARLRAGGIAQISYNALPGWQGALGMQRVVREAGVRAAGRSDTQAMAGMQAVRDLAAAEAGYLGESRVVRNTLQHLDRFPAEYIAHEYMNASWSPCFHMDVCNDLAPARLEWAASNHLIDSFPELSLTPEQRAVVDRYDEPVMRELMRDMCQERSLRNDVFVRGLTRLRNTERDARLRSLVLAPTKPRSEFKSSIAVPVGEAGLEPKFYGPIMDRLAEGPCAVGALLDLPGIEGRRRDNPAELVGMLVGSLQAIPVNPRPGQPVGDALNHAIGARFEANGALNARGALASGVLGTGWPCTVPELAVWRRLGSDQVIDLAAIAVTLLPQGSAEEREKMQVTLAGIAATLPPLWRTLGIAPKAGAA